MNAPESMSTRPEFKNHDLVDDTTKPGIRFEKRPAKTPEGATVPGLYNAWITLDNAAQFNSYTTAISRNVPCSSRHSAKLSPDHVEEPP